MALKLPFTLRPSYMHINPAARDALGNGTQPTGIQWVGSTDMIEIKREGWGGVE